MAQGDVTINFTTSDAAPDNSIAPIMQGYQAAPVDRLEASTLSGDFHKAVRDTNKAANGDVALNVNGNLEAALNAAYDKKLNMVEITHTAQASTFGLGGKEDVLFRGTMTPELAVQLEKAVTEIGKKLKEQDTECAKANFTSNQCELIKQTIPAAVINDTIGKSGNAR